MLYCFGGCSRALGGASPLPLQRHGLRAAQDGAGSAGGSHAQVHVVFVLACHVQEAADRCRAFVSMVVRT